MSDKPATLAAALAAFQAALPTIRKGETAKVPTKSGGEYSYKFADLADVNGVVMPLLGAVGLSFSAKPTLRENRFVLAYRLLHESGEFDDGEYPLPQSGTPQEYGSAITYARRYVLCSITGVAPDKDDDGAQASTRAHVATERRVEWDPVEQELLVAGWEAEIADAVDEDALTAIGRSVKASQRRKELSPASFDQLARKAAERKAEMNGASQHKPAEEAAPV